MVIIVLILVSFTLIGVIVVAVFVSAQKERARLRSVVRRGVTDLVSALNFAFLEPLDPRIDTGAKLSYKDTLSRILVSDYMRSEEIRRVVDAALPRRGYRRNRPLDPGPPA
jgi:hypothetical protein